MIINSRRLVTYAAVVPVTAGALWFGAASGGAVSTFHAATYHGSTTFSLMAAGHDGGLHADAEYEFRYLPDALSGTTRTIVI